MEMLKTAATFFWGFASGCLYSSYKFDRNPNELIGMAKDDVRMATVNTVVAVHNVADKIGQKFKKGGEGDV